MLAGRGLRPKHRLGQNFLHDHNQLRRLIDASGLAAGELVLEIGPGTGTLTEAMLEMSATVIACEIDQDMIAILEDRVTRLHPDRFTLIKGDALQRERALNAEIASLIGERSFKLIANLPYQIASPLMTTLLIDHPNCTGQFVTIQKEVADRLLAKPSSDAFGGLTVIAQTFGDIERVATLSPSCFWPEPDVVSAMVSIIPKRNAMLIRRNDGRAFARFVTELFSKRRKQLGTIVGRGHASWAALAIAGITPDLRPEALNVDQFATLWRATASDRPHESAGG